MSGTLQKLSRQTYAGLFLVTCATLMFEILLTRIFSVTMWYHFAFMAISIAMFGITVGGLLVYLNPSRFTADSAKSDLGVSSLLFSVAIVVCFLIYLSVPFVPEWSLGGVLSMAAIYIVVALPFIFGGICICITLTRFVGQVSNLYAADLGGAAVGCLLLVGLMELTDGPGAVVVVAALGGVGATLFCLDAGRKRLAAAALGWVLLLAGGWVLHGFVLEDRSSILQLRWVKGEREPAPLHEVWNSFSRIRVIGNPDVPEEPTVEGLSSRYPLRANVRRLYMDIDATAGTYITGFTGDPAEIEHFRYDVTNIVHHIRPDSRVLVIGTGGGSEILAALAFDQPSVRGVEINKDILDTVNERFGEFTGHLDRIPRVEFVNDEARAYMTRQTENFDIVQASLIDTWAATAAGAMALTENSLYTVEAWATFLERLEPRGIVTFSRWFFEDNPGEMYRLTTLATAALRETGVTEPRDHIVIVKNTPPIPQGWRPDGVGTMLVGRDPFSDEDLDTLERVSREMGFEIVLTPRYSADANFEAFASGPATERIRGFPLLIDPPTDDRPFFFQMLRLRDFFKKERWRQGGMSFNLKAVSILMTLLLVVGTLTACCIVLPLILTRGVRSEGHSWSLIAYFMAIGLGFMLVEVSLMQRLILFLGPPVYSLTVVLFTLLLSGGLGSLWTRRLDGAAWSRQGVLYVGMVAVVVALAGLATPAVLGAFRGSITAVRVAVAAGVLFPLGFFLGMAFPIGMKAAASRVEADAPLLWGINGAAGVLASVLAFVIALGAGISAAFWAGLACYLVAWAALALTARGQGMPAGSS